MPAAWIDVANGALPSLARAIVTRISEEIPEYATDPRGMILAETRNTVRVALRTFMSTVFGGESLTEERADVFRRVGRNEALAGRSHDTLQGAYRIASQTVMQQVLEWERHYPASRASVAAFSSAMFRFIDGLARLSAEGFASVQPQRADLARERARLIAILTQGGGFSRKSVEDRAARLNWPVPTHCAVAEVVASGSLGDEDFVGFVDEAFGVHALAAIVGGRHLVIDPDVLAVDRLRRAVEWNAAGLRVFVGPRVPLAEAAGSCQLAHRATGTLDSIARGDGGIALCDEHLLTLLTDSATDVVRALARLHLAPLSGLSVAKRVKYGRLLSAWLEFGSLRGAEPGVLDKHRQTLRYQVGMLEQMFGPALDDRSARLGMMLALRLVLPEWEREAAALSRSARGERREVIPPV